METLSKRLVWARAQSGLSQRGLARAAELASQRHIGFLETGERDNPAVRTVQAVATALGVTLDWFVSGVGPTPTPRQIKRAAQAAFARSEQRRPKRKKAA